MARIVIDETECTGCELCVDMLPAVFRMNNKGVSEVPDSADAGDSELQNVIDNCPAECIHRKK